MVSDFRISTRWKKAHSIYNIEAAEVKAGTGTGEKWGGEQNRKRADGVNSSFFY